MFYLLRVVSRALYVVFYLLRVVSRALLFLCSVCYTYYLCVLLVTLSILRTVCPVFDLLCVVSRALFVLFYLLRVVSRALFCPVFYLLRVVSRALFCLVLWFCFLSLLMSDEKYVEGNSSG